MEVSSIKRKTGSQCLLWSKVRGPPSPNDKMTKRQKRQEPDQSSRWLSLIPLLFIHLSFILVLSFPSIYDPLAPYLEFRKTRLKEKSDKKCGWREEMEKHKLGGRWGRDIRKKSERTVERTKRRETDSSGGGGSRIVEIHA